MDDDLARTLRERARLLNLPFEQVVNDTLRRGLSPGSDEAQRPEHHLVPHRSGLAPGVDPLRLNQTNDQLESETFGQPGTACGEWLHYRVAAINSAGTGPFSDPRYAGGDPLVARYDDNSNGTIERNEVITAINDYLDGEAGITRAGVIRLINLYLDG